MSSMLTAHQLPVKLVDEIAWQAAAQYPQSGLDIRVMATFSLVKRRWAELCRPIIWQWIRITSEARHQSICAILDTVPPPSLAPVKDLIHSVMYDFTQSDGTPPWFHRMHNALAPRLSHTPFASFMHNVASGPPILNSFVPDLPRTLPGMSLSLTAVTFNIFGNTRLRSRSALLRLLATAPQLRVVSCTAVPWASNAPLTPSLALNSSLREINLHPVGGLWLDVDDVCWWLPPLIGHRSRPTSRDARALQESSALPESELTAITSAIRCIIAKMQLIHAMLIRRDDIDTDLHAATIGLLQGSEDLSNKGIQVDIYYKISSDALTFLKSTSPRIVNIVRVKFYLTSSFFNDVWTMEDWKQILIHFSLLSKLERLSFAFRSEEDAKTFVDEYGPVFDQATRCLKLDISNDDGARWRPFREEDREKRANSGPDATTRRDIRRRNGGSKDVPE